MDIICIFKKIFCFSALFAITVFAFTGICMTAELEIDTQSAQAGQTVDFKVTVNNAPNLATAFGFKEIDKRFTIRTLTIMTSLGVFIYAGIGLYCLLAGGNFLDYTFLNVPEARGMGMLGIEIGVGITVMAVMVSIFRDLINFE